MRMAADSRYSTRRNTDHLYLATSVNRILGRVRTITNSTDAA